MYHILFTYTSFDGHGWLHFLTIMNNVEINIAVRTFVQVEVTFKLN